MPRKRRRPASRAAARIAYPLYDFMQVKSIPIAPFPGLRAPSVRFTFMDVLALAQDLFYDKRIARSVKKIDFRHPAAGLTRNQAAAPRRTFLRFFLLRRREW